MHQNSPEACRILITRCAPEHLDLSHLRGRKAALSDYLHAALKTVGEVVRYSRVSVVREGVHDEVNSRSRETNRKGCWPKRATRQRRRRHAIKCCGIGKVEINCRHVGFLLSGPRYSDEQSGYEI